MNNIRRVHQYFGDPTSLPLNPAEINTFSKTRVEILGGAYFQSLTRLTPVSLTADGYVEVCPANESPIGFIFADASGTGYLLPDSAIGSGLVAVMTAGGICESSDMIIEDAFDANVPLYVGADGKYTITAPAEGVTAISVGRTITKKLSTDTVYMFAIYPVNQ